ncbi:ATP-grasp domain-containing protein [Actinosynnema sp. CA-299493]
MKTVALVTDQVSLPIDHDMPPLLAACRAAGLAPEVCDWYDTSVDWARFDAVVPRSPWTYVDRLPDFLAWCEVVDAASLLLNPLVVARWVLDKHYVADLAARGVPVVPTRFVEPGADPLQAVREVLAEHPGVKGLVVKPTVGAYSKDVQRFARTPAEETARYAGKLLDAGAHVMIQPYFESVDRHGETDLVFFEEEFSHSIRKDAMLSPDGTVDVPTLDARAPREADDEERAVALAALDAAASHLGVERPLLYGRVDLIRDDDGRPVVLELDLCEPSLNLSFTDTGATWFAEALARRLGA